MRLTLLAATALLASTANETQAALAPPAAGFRNVALSTTPLPGLPAGVMVEQFSFPRIDRLGRVGFKARLIQGPGGVTADNKEAIFSEVATNDLRHVARSGEVVSGINFRFHDVEPGENLRMSGNGALYFISGMSPLASPSTFNSGIFRFTKQRGLELVVSSSPTGVPNEAPQWSTTPSTSTTSPTASSPCEGSTMRPPRSSTRPRAGCTAMRPGPAGVPSSPSRFVRATSAPSS